MSLSASVAVRAPPTFWPAAVFSATLRAAVSAENAGGLLGTAAATAAVAALVSVSALLASSVKLTVTLIVVPWSAATSV